MVTFTSLPLPLLVFFSTITASLVCTSDIRLAGARQVPISYNSQLFTAAADEFLKVPWGPECTILMYIFPSFRLKVPTSRSRPRKLISLSNRNYKVRYSLTIHRYPNGGPGVPVAITGATSYAFAVASRQVFSKVTGEYTDFGNGTTVIATNVVRLPFFSLLRPFLLRVERKPQRENGTLMGNRH
jgi:hypothetical protein